MQVGESQKIADIATKLVVIDYDTEGLGEPILSVEEALKKSSLFEIPPFLRGKPVGDITKGMSEAEHKILRSKVGFGSFHRHTYMPLKPYFCLIIMFIVYM